MLPSFKEIIVELSYNCNLSCSMCGFGKAVNPFSTSKYLSIEKYEAILNQVGGLTETIRLNGRGESTIHPDFIRILNFTKNLYPKLNINLFSNFSFNNIEILNSLVDKGVQLFISLDSTEEDELADIRKGSRFKSILKNIEKVRNLSKRPFIIFTIQEVNIHRIFDIGNFAFQNDCHILYNTIRRDRGIESFVSIVHKNIQSIVEQFDNVHFLYKNSQLRCLYPDQLAGVYLNGVKPSRTHGSMESCPALENELCILYDGTITPCNMFNPFIYGNIFELDLNEVWEGKNRIDFLKSYKDHYYCKNCANLGM